MYKVEFESGSMTDVRRFDVYPYVHARSVSSRTVVMRLFASYRNCKYCPESSWTFETRLLPSYASVSLFPLRSVIRTNCPADVILPALGAEDDGRRRGRRRPFRRRDLAERRRAVVRRPDLDLDLVVAGLVPFRDGVVERRLWTDLDVMGI